mmetsp:Transcript_5310/g.8188  ORF Transcript_5310/g.8188 Transcript_5310/m.8188 type:complete len:171 (-) Transcript_5310:324-836(-)|eukprot:CAMPEP_0203766926 /NCGR_PEP_ID=MMETSP0099_2-20121227/702_1 /ASSEMBLY_ACC=CAM_ASM_000209 /TAXON_ID=96639 /ORGANISM=" , Strain NY0313808BC1" /LENGTH=170 /DNA_ID=CAMNT_0050663357 /DNA_START=188 /DNA_END=700 /DNA_ORIENTATION=-
MLLSRRVLGSVGVGGILFGRSNSVARRGGGVCLFGRGSVVNGVSGFCSNVGGEKTRAEKNKENVGKVRDLIRNYGPVGVGVYLGIYVGNIGLFYGLLQSNVIGAGDALSLLNYLNITEYYDVSAISPRQGNFALAWIMTKLTEPLRFVLAVSITPSLARRIGWAPEKVKD